MNKISTAQIHIKAKEGEFTPPLPSKYPGFMLNLVRLGFNTFGRLFPTVAAKIAYRLFATPRYRAVHKKSDVLLETARLFEVLYGKRILKAYEWGEGDRVVLLVHGWESRGTALRSFVPGLVEQGYRVVAFDGPAHGDSEGKRTNLMHFGGAIIAMIRHLGSVETIIGHSFGGASAMYALSQAEPTISLKKIVLISAPAKMTTVIAGVKKTLKLPANVYQKFLSDIQSLLGMPLESANITELHHLVAVEEALIVHDIDDPIVPYSYSCATAEAWPEAKLISTEGMGHYLLMKHLRVIQEVVRFIE